MENEILDHFDDQYDKNVKIIPLKYFNFEQEARLYSARLSDEGIKSFVSNANTITAFPLDQQGIGLHIKEDDLERASKVVMEMDEKQYTPVDENFHDADLGDIEYQKKLTQDLLPNWVWMTILVLVILSYLIGIIPVPA